MTEYRLADILLTEHIIRTPISVGSGDAIKILAINNSRNFLNGMGIDLPRVCVTFSCESLCTSLDKLYLTKKKITRSLIKAPIEAIMPAKSTL
jgi:hypothetical protein